MILNRLLKYTSTVFIVLNYFCAIKFAMSASVLSRRTLNDQRHTDQQFQNLIFRENKQDQQEAHTFDLNEAGNYHNRRRIMPKSIFFPFQLNPPTCSEGYHYNPFSKKCEKIIRPNKPPEIDNSLIDYLNHAYEEALNKLKNKTSEVEVSKKPIVPPVLLDHESSSLNAESFVYHTIPPQLANEKNINESANKKTTVLRPEPQVIRSTQHSTILNDSTANLTLEQIYEVTPVALTTKTTTATTTTTNEESTTIIPTIDVFIEEHTFFKTKEDKSGTNPFNYAITTNSNTESSTVDTSTESDDYQLITNESENNEETSTITITTTLETTELDTTTETSTSIF